MIINFKCIQCNKVFNCDIGNVSLSNNSFRPQFENDITCPFCGKRSVDEVLLTELGQSQLTEATLNIDYDSADDYGLYQGDCQGCDHYETLNDLGLCEICFGKLDRDLIRQREWSLSSLAFGCPQAQLEDLRKNIIKQYGEKLELTAPSKNEVRRSKKSRKKRKK